MNLLQHDTQGRTASAVAPRSFFPSVLLGGRSAPGRRGAFSHVAFVWLPVVVMLLVIVRESTSTFGSDSTSRWLRLGWQALFGHVPDQKWESIHHILRKTGHFVGYGTLGLTWLRAFLLTWIWSFRQRTAAVWRRWSVQMALGCTAMVAACDEVHQSYLANRTGMVSDVLLDTAGAASMILVCVFIWRLRGRWTAGFVN